jgi:hypothetical protein
VEIEEEMKKRREGERKRLEDSVEKRRREDEERRMRESNERKEKLKITQMYNQKKMGEKVISKLLDREESKE